MPPLDRAGARSGDFSTGAPSLSRGRYPRLGGLWVVIAFLLSGSWAVRADQSVSLGWKASPDPRAAGYTIVYGTASGAYVQSTDVGNATQATIGGLVGGLTYYFAVYAYGDGSLQKSDLSNEIAYQVPVAGPSASLSWTDPGDITYGTPLGPQQLNASASVPGSFAYSPPAGTVLPAGAGQALQVIFLPFDQANYAPITNVVQINVQKAALQVIADNKSRIFGGPLPALTASYAGFVKGDSPADLAALPILSTAATPTSSAGTYPITAAGAASPNYSISYLSGVLTITGPTLTSLAVTPGNFTMSVGQSRPLAVIGTFSDGSTQDLASAVRWTLAKPDVASVDRAGLVTATARGTTIMTASLNGIASMSFLTVGKGDAATNRVAGLNGPVSLYVVANQDEGSAVVALAGSPGTVCQLQASSDLENWEDVETVTLASGAAIIIDRDAALHATRIYRLRAAHLPSF